MRILKQVLLGSLIVMTLVSCANVFGRTVLTYAEKTDYKPEGKVEQVRFFYDKSVDPTGVVPKGLNYTVIAKVKVKGKVPSANSDNSFMAPLSNKSHYSSELKKTHLALAERLEDEAKNIGADIVIITQRTTEKEQRVEGVIYNTTSKVVIGPWFDVPVLRATLARSKP